MAEIRGDAEFHRLSTPRAAAVAGVVFGLLFASSIVLLRSALPGAPGDPWVSHQREPASFTIDHAVAKLHAFLAKD